MANNVKNRKQMQKLEDELAKSTRFSKQQVRCLLEYFHSKVSDKKSIDRHIMRDILHNEFDITDQLILDRVYVAFDLDKDNKIVAEEFVRGMSVFMLGTMKERMKFCFDVYDLNNDNFISREEMMQLLKKTIALKQQDEDPDESTRDLTEAAMKKLKKIETDKENRITFEEYSARVGEDALLLEFLGTCLPNDEACRNFAKKYL